MTHMKNLFDLLQQPVTDLKPIDFIVFVPGLVKIADKTHGLIDTHAPDLPEIGVLALLLGIGIGYSAFYGFRLAKRKRADYIIKTHTPKQP